MTVRHKSHRTTMHHGALDAAPEAAHLYGLWAPREGADHDLLEK